MGLFLIILEYFYYNVYEHEYQKIVKYLQNYRVSNEAKTFRRFSRRNVSELMS